MRTTIELPDELLRRTKAAAALRGVKMKDLITAWIRAGLESNERSVQPSLGRHRPIPVTIAPTGRPIPVMTNAEVFGILEREDDERHGRPA